MKKLLVFLLSLLLALSLAACGGSNEHSNNTQDDDAPLVRADGADASLNREDDTETSEPDESQTDLDSYDPNADLLSQSGSLNRNSLTPEQIAEIEADAAESGYEISWNADGSLLIIEDGSAISASGAWPDNEFTADVPAPKAGTVSASQTDGDAFVIVMTWTAEEAKAYAEDLKAAGFDRGVDEQDMESMGMYLYTGSNGEYTVSASYMSGSGGIEIVKADPQDLENQDDNSPDEGEQIAGDDLQKQLEEAQKELENLDLPEGYEQYLPEGFDLESLLP